MKKFIFLIILIVFVFISMSGAQSADKVYPLYSENTRQLIALVKDASGLIRETGEAAFDDFRRSDSRWRQSESYIFVLDRAGNMLVHPDSILEGKNQINLKDVNGRFIIKGLLDAATMVPGKPEGWYHYEWPVPGGLIPRWKSSYVLMVHSPEGREYVVGSGMYNDNMERTFVIDIVKDAVARIEKDGVKAYKDFYDHAGAFRVKDAYVFVIDSGGIEIVNPAFVTLEGRNLMDLKDKQGREFVREMFLTVKSAESGWVDYMWPKPGESVPTLKSTYVSKAALADQWVLVGCGVYLADAPRAVSAGSKMSAVGLMKLVYEAAEVFEKKGEQAFSEFRQRGTKWFHDDTYFFVWSTDGKRIFHAALPEIEGVNVNSVTDVLGRPWGKMFLNTAASTKGEGWIHYMYPEPGDIFPTWKSSFVKRVTFPSGTRYLIGCGIYHMDMDKSFIEDVVNRAAERIEMNGREAFSEIRDIKGSFVFMDTYVFVDDTAGVELVNPVQPSLEGRNLMNAQDVQGKFMVKAYISAALKNGAAWVDYYWYRPGESEPARKQTFVRKVQYQNETFVVGAGLYELKQVD